jgi:hypothetical protein
MRADRVAIRGRQRITATHRRNVARKMARWGFRAQRWGWSALASRTVMKVPLWRYERVRMRRRA